MVNWRTGCSTPHNSQGETLHKESKQVERDITQEQPSMESRYVKVASRFFLVVNPCDAGDDDAGCLDYHFLDACFLCKRDITFNRHIFMYKGDAAFCSDDCRQDQMDMDAALKALARRHRTLRKSSPAAAACAVNKAAPASPPVMARRPTVADLTTRAPAVSG